MGKDSVVGVLLSKGANVNLKNNSGKTPQEIICSGYSGSDKESKRSVISLMLSSFEKICFSVSQDKTLKICSEEKENRKQFHGKQVKEKKRFF